MKYLELKWTISKARDTYGYNICTLKDGEKKYRCSGGGYDMEGTVFGEWLWANHKDKIIEIITPRINEFYGFKDGKEYCQPGKFWLDGSCGLDCMIKIAKAIGLSVERDYRKSLKGFMIGEINE